MVAPHSGRTTRLATSPTSIVSVVSSKKSCEPPLTGGNTANSSFSFNIVSGVAYSWFTANKSERPKRSRRGNLSTRFRKALETVAGASTESSRELASTTSRAAPKNNTRILTCPCASFIQAQSFCRHARCSSQVRAAVRALRNHSLRYSTFLAVVPNALTSSVIRAVPVLRQQRSPSPQQQETTNAAAQYWKYR